MAFVVLRRWPFYYFIGIKSSRLRVNGSVRSFFPDLS